MEVEVTSPGGRSLLTSLTSKLGSFGRANDVKDIRMEKANQSPVNYISTE